MKFAIIIAALAAPAFAESQKEKDLASRLAESQARLIVAQKDRAAIAAALAASIKIVATGRVSAADTAAINAEAAQTTADANSAEARKEAREAKAALAAFEKSTESKAREADSKRDSDIKYYSIIIGGVVAFVGVFVPLIGLLITKATKHQEAVDQREMLKLEKSLDNIGAQVQQVHVLVNSNLTNEKQRSLAALKASLTSLLKLQVIGEKTGAEPSPDERAVIDDTAKNIAELEAELADRLKATATASAELAEARATR